MSSRIKKLIVIVIFILLGLSAGSLAWAQSADLGLQYGEQIGLSATDPRLVVANIIRIVLGFLGVLAVALIIYAGWMYMTAAGSAEKVEKAKKILIQALIGLLIILASFGIASFIINRFLGATNTTNSNGAACQISSDCGAGLICCAGSCQSACGIAGCIGSNCSSFSVLSTTPRDQAQDIVKNSRIKVLFNKELDHSLSPEVIADNFKVEKIADVNPDSGALISLDTAETLNGNIATSTREFTFSADGDCGDVNNSTVCLPAWSQIKVTLDGFSGIKAVNGSSLTCDDNSCEFIFSTNNTLDLENPTSGLDPFQICAAADELKTDANMINGWGGDNYHIASLYFYEISPDGTESVAHIEPGNNGTYQEAAYQVSVEGKALSDIYKFKLEVTDSADNKSDSQVNAIIRPAHCCNGQEDADETGLDCGGADCLSCDELYPDNGSSCLNAADPATACASGQVCCAAGTAFAGACRDNEAACLIEGEGDNNNSNAGANTSCLNAADPATACASGQVCCAAGTAFAGACKNNLYECYQQPKDCVYEYEFIAHEEVATTPDCSTITDVTQCSQYSGCCVDAMNNNACANGTQLSDGDGHCAYYTCQSGTANCDTDNPVASVGAGQAYYQDVDQCITSCASTPGGAISCTQNSDCVSGQVCCSGLCKSENECYPQAKNCVYEYEFSTNPESKPGDPCYTGAASGSCDITQSECTGDLVCDAVSCTCQGGPGYVCGDAAVGNCSASDDCATGLVCDASSCTCENGGEEDNPFMTCSGYNQDQCAASLFCPNSPGNCSAYDPGDGATKITGNCDYSCNNFSSCSPGKCTYNSTLNRCLNEGDTCSLDGSAQDALGRTVTTVCALEGGEPRWHFNSNISCPDSWQKNNNNECYQLGDSGKCDLCDSGFKCTNLGGSGVCTINQSVCSGGATCYSDNKCKKADSATCECCCDKNKNTPTGTNPACCAPLTCDNTCGVGDVDNSEPANGTFNDLGDFSYGLCSGCANAGTTIKEHDDACNCTGASGKFCEITPSKPNGVCRDCAQLENSADCSDHSSACCVDAMRSDSCRGNNNVQNITQNNLSYCAYYQCNAGGVGCDTAGPVASSTNAAKLYYNINQCSNQCLGPDQFGEACISEGHAANPLVTIPEATCDKSICSNFYCLNNSNDPYASTPPDQCGLCCCDPAKISSDTSSPNYDKCKNLSTDLTCRPNQTPCDGNNRGLCCGCSADSQCGDTSAYGCGSDTCCRNRPTIESTVPNNNATDICRNAQIQATANEFLDPSTLASNVVVAADYLDSACPDGLGLLTKNGEIIKKPSFFAVVLNKTKRFANNLLRPLFGPIIGQEAFADPANNYCQIPGKVTSYNTAGDQTIIQFSPTNLLPANKDIYVIIRGDENLDSSQGVKNAYGIGLSGQNLVGINQFNSVSFSQAHIWKFTTLGVERNNGICELTSVNINPASYLFNTNINNITEENDSNTTNVTFDTIADSDKVFLAEAYSSDNQVLNSVNGYSWIYDWSFETLGIAATSSEPGYDIHGDRQFVRANSNITDGDTILDATANVNSGEKYVTGTSSITVFICKNPWPAKQANGEWYPWEDQSANCNVVEDLGGGNTGINPNCINSNYKLYYCRDAGGEGTTDDLPALLSPVKTRGQSYTCAYGPLVGQPCSSNADCNGGLCKQILKEFYFFQ